MFPERMLIPRIETSNALGNRELWWNRCFGPAHEKKKFTVPINLGSLQSIISFIHKAERLLQVAKKTWAGGREIGTKFKETIRAHLPSMETDSLYN